MDSRKLLECFHGTLQGDHKVIAEAERQLKELSAHPGFLAGCLDLIGSNEHIDANICKAAAVYFKNRIVNYWSASSKYPEAIDNDEKPIIKDNILPVFIKSSYNVKQQLIPVLRVLITNEFPSRWPNLLNTTGQLLQTQNNEELYAGILCFSEICRKFRWYDNAGRSSDLDPIITQVFPHLIIMGNAIVQQGADITEYSAEILKLILKCYKFVTYFDLPVVLQERESILAWAQLMGSVINMPTANYIKNVNGSEAEKSMLQISKCNKWAIANIYRLYTKYASTGLNKNYNYNEFFEIYTKEVIPQVISNFLQLIEQWCQGNRWFAQSTLYWLLELLSHCVTQKHSWSIIKPIFETLVEHLVFPLLCPSDEVLEIYQIEPQEYISQRIDIYESKSADIAALAFLVTLVNKRRKTTLTPIVTFAYNKLTETANAPEETLEVAKQKEGALRLIGAVSDYLVITQSEYYNQMEQFFANLVVPNFNSKYDFVKTRALEVASKFADLQFTNPEVVARVFQCITENFNSESSLPVNFICSLVIQAFLSNEQFKEALGQIILPTMQRLLELSEEIDHDAISAVMQECVEGFSEQLQPFGVDLISKLVEQFLRLGGEVKDSLASIDPEDFTLAGGDDGSDKTMAAIGLLNTMITVLLSFESSKEILQTLENLLLPVIEFIFTNKLDDFFSEAADLIENLTFLLRSISPNMWIVFDLIAGLFQKEETGILGLYFIEELMPPIENFLIFGGQVPDSKIPQFYLIFKTILSGDELVGLSDIVGAFTLAQSMILCIQTRAPIIDILNDTLESTITADRAHSKSMAFEVNVYNVIVAALVYDLNQTVSVLESKGKYLTSITRWLEIIPTFNRVYDLKLSILGLISIVNSTEQLEKLESQKPGVVAQIVSSIMCVLKKLPDAISNLEKKRKEFSEPALSNWDLEKEFNQQYDDDEDEGAETGEQSRDRDEGSGEGWEDEDFDSYVKNELKTNGYYDDDDELLYEDPLLSTPLDNLNVFQLFKDFIVGMQSVDSQKHQVLFGKLSESDADVMNSVFEIVKN